MSTNEPKNLLGETLQPCGTDPMTGFYRDGCCRTDEADRGSHTVCAVLSAEFLAFTAAQGNDLSTPRPEYGFPGLGPGDRWCLCALRWLEADEAGCAPPIVAAATNEAATRLVPRERLIAAARDAH